MTFRSRPALAILVIAFALLVPCLQWAMTPGPMLDFDATRLSQVLLALGQPNPEHAVRVPAGIELRDLVERGREIYFDGLTTTPEGARTERQSKFFTCSQCHLSEREDPDLATSDPIARLAWLDERNLGLLPGTTLYGTVNKTSWYNEDYGRKYGDLVQPARSSLREAVQLCSEQCSQGRRLSDFELEAVLAYLWSIEYRLDDLRLSTAERDRVARAAQAGRPDPNLRELLLSRFRQASPAHFGDGAAPEARADGEAARGRVVFERGCLACHAGEGPANRSFAGADGLEALASLMREGEAHAVVREGKAPPSSRKGRYMPEYTLERLADAQLADLAAFVVSPVVPVRKNVPDPASRSGRAREEVQPARLAAETLRIFETYCYRCHDHRREEGGFDLSVHEHIIAEGEYVVPGDPAKSVLWERVGIDQDMPPAKDKKDSTPIAVPGVAEREVIRQWIEAGAPEWVKVDSPRAPISDLQTLQAIHDHLDGVGRDDRAYQRYFVLDPVWNNARRTGDDLAYLRAALAKALNSLHWSLGIVVPQAVNEQGTIFAIDLRRLTNGYHEPWMEAREWHVLLAAYPYGYTFESNQAYEPQAEGERKVDLYQRIAQWTRSALPYLRADWFVAEATRPPVYERLLGLPRTVAELERQLGVDSVRGLLDGQARRAGFLESRVSSHNRMVELHQGRLGTWYWKSFDFGSSTGRQNLKDFPLGPRIDGNPFDRFAFEHNGGEMIFSLPDGLQGYYLADAKGNFLPDAPPDIVEDSKRTAGTSVVVNGLSCMGCHKDGMIRFRDDIREQTTLLVQGGAGRKVRDLYVANSEWQGLLDQQEARFKAAAGLATAPFLPPGLTEEPIGEAVNRFQDALDLADVAVELGVSAEQLRAALDTNEALQRLNLHGIERAQWQERGGGITTRFHKALRQFRRGTPYSAN